MMAKTHIGPNAERQFQWYSPETAAGLPAFLDSAGTRPGLAAAQKQEKRAWAKC